MSAATDLHLYYLWTPERTAEYLGINIATLHKYRRQRLIGYVKFRGNIRFRTKDAIDFVRKHSIPVAA